MKAVLGRFPVGLGVHVEDVDAGLLQGVLGGPGRLAHHLDRFQGAEKVLFRAAGHHAEGLGLGHVHADHLHRVGKRDLHVHRLGVCLGHRGLRGDEHAEMGERRSAQQTHCNRNTRRQPLFHRFLLSFGKQKSHESGVFMAPYLRGLRLHPEQCGPPQASACDWAKAIRKCSCGVKAKPAPRLSCCVAAGRRSRKPNPEHETPNTKHVALTGLT